jgi:hypothetical protein
LGDKPVVEFLRLLCTAVARAIQWVQSSGDADVTSRRYCSTHWFFRSDRPSVWGWNAVDKFCWIPNFWLRALPKWDVKRGSLSLITLLGSPNHRYTWSMYNCAISGPVIVVEQGRNIVALEHPWSTIVRIASFPLCFGSPVIRSMAILWKGSVPSSVVMRYSGVFGLCVRILFCWHVAQPLT